MKSENLTIGDSLAVVQYTNTSSKYMMRINKPSTLEFSYKMQSFKLSDGSISDTVDLILNSSEYQIKAISQNFNCAIIYRFENGK